MGNSNKFILDEKIEYERIKQFASQVDHLPSGLVKDFEEGYKGDHNMEFYHGMLAGLAAAYSVATNNQFIKNKQVDGTIGAILAFISSKFKEKIE